LASAATIASNIPREDARQRARETIELLLRRLRLEVSTGLAVDLGWAERSSSGEKADPLPFLLTKVVESQSYSRIVVLADLYTDLCQKHDWEPAEIVNEIIEEATPLVFVGDRVDELWTDIYIRKSAFYYAKDYHSTTLEALMACADGKPMRHKPPRNEAPVHNFEGAPFLSRAGKLPLAAPSTRESVAKSILVDLCKGHDPDDPLSESSSLDELVQSLAGILTLMGQRKNKERTLYCFHKMPENPTEHDVHKDALTIIGENLLKLKEANSKAWGDMPRFVFIVLAETSDQEGLRKILVKVLRTRFHYEQNRSGYAASP
jgi:hypothetical protein